MAVCTAAGTRSTTIASSSSYFLGTLAIGTTSVSAGGAIIEVAGQVKITGGTPGLGKVLTSDATGLASWGNGPTSAGSGYMKLLYNDETDATGVNAQASVKTYAVPANSYSPVMVEAEVAYDVTSAAFGEFRFDLIYATVTKESLSLKQGGDVANTYKVAGVVKYSEAMPAGGTVQLDTVKIVTAANNWYVKSFRVYGIY